MSNELGNIDFINEQQTYLGPSSGNIQAGPETQEKIDPKLEELLMRGTILQKNSYKK